MRKIVALILTMIMAFTLVACGNGIQKGKTENVQVDNTDKRILVAYFSFSGNTKVIADKIHKNVGGNIFEIKSVDKYPTDYDALLNQAKKEQKENYRPKLETKVDNIDSYDVIFIGYPIWWGTLPMSVFSFLEQTNLSGKTIVPFSTNDGSGLGTSIDDIKKTCQQSTILEGLAIPGKSVNNADKDILDWLKKIDITK